MQIELVMNQFLSDFNEHCTFTHYFYYGYLIIWQKLYDIIVHAILY